MNIINREIWNVNESEYSEYLDIPVTPDEVKDGGYAFSAPKPDSVSENIPIFNIGSINERLDDYKNISPENLRKSVQYIESLNNVKSVSRTDLSKLLQNYLIAVQNLDDALKIATNDIKYFNNILKIQKLFKKVGVMNEDLVYFHVDDATKDEYNMMSEDGTSLYTNVHGTVQPDDNHSIDERVKTFMPKSKSVSVKKNCRLGGKEDGTSDACNQGDIEVLKFNKIDESKEKKSLLTEEKVRFGVVMAYFDIPKWESIISKIKEEDLYDDGSGTFGREHDPHITVLYGLHDDVTKQDVLPLVEGETDIEVEVNGISLFENENFDVVKFEVTPTEQLLKLREKLLTLPHTLTYNDYKPHMTLAYVKKGEGKKYKKQFENPIKLTSNNLIFSTKDKEKTKINLNDKSNDK